jgi:aminoglycoside 3-N-acetyltransferase
MTEYFRKLPHVQRSLEGIFSVACSGPEAADWVNVGTNCFGKNSIFEKMFSRNVKLVFLGETFDITFMHFIEQRLGVGYRYIKPFPGQILTPNGLQDYVFEYNVRDLEKNVWYDLPKIANHLDQAGVIRKVSLGHSQVRVLRAQDAYAVLKEALGNDERFLLRD